MRLMATNWQLRCDYHMYVMYLCISYTNTVWLYEAFKLHCGSYKYIMLRYMYVFASILKIHI